MWKPTPREAQTTMPCKKCNQAVKILRSCHQAYIICEHCHTKFTIQEYLPIMDTAMEEFMEAINCDRI
ncbi:dual CXXC motif small (seleno)protein [Desulfovibrio litoralis]|uniref:Uncharacterized protein n=1 Tax=Desulfovibrio litoralis DSM 11393 TaxID=1121455 RepID=A0A1M7SSB1_9BACT|nr:dual CXXC motif small (seleno)protein [Desulfovibrio litoralis]SHN61379.1 hypothetical protein SAMN02745728_01217 [Desulfovibrio litoralis DSM 11393]